MRRRGLKFLLAGALLTAALIVSTILPVHSQKLWCDRVAGSMKTQTVILGIARPARITESPLARRLHAIGYRWTPIWSFLGDEPKDIWGGVVVYEDGPAAPPIYTFHDLSDAFASSASDAEIRRFADTMKNGAAKEQLAAIDAAIDKTLAASEVDPAAH